MYRSLSSRPTFAFAFLLIALTVFSYVLLQNFRTLTGLLVTPHVINDEDFSIVTGMTHNDDMLTIPPDTHVIATCPSEETPAGRRWAAPQDYADVDGIMLYEFSSDFSEKNGNWTGKSYGFGQPENFSLTTFIAGKTYYAHANEQFDFSCSVPDAQSGSGSSSSDAGPPSPSPAAYWPLEEGSGAVAADSAGGNDATIVGDALWTIDTPSSLSGSVAAIHVQGGHLSVPHHTGAVFDLSGSDPFTISFWIKVPENSSGPVMSKYSTTENKGWNIELDPSADDTLNLTFQMRRALFSGISVSALQALSVDTFHHVVITYDGSGNAGGVAIFVDGSPAFLIQNYNNLGSDTVHSTVPLTIGKSNSASFNGIFDDIKLYTTVVPFAQIGH